MATERSSANACVLVVDDEPEIRRILARIAGEAGHRVETAASFTSASEQLERHRVDVVLCDLRMPGADGTQAIRDIVARHAAIAVVAVTAVEDPAVIERVLEAGAAGYVTKPFKPSDIAIAIHQALQRREHDAARSAEQRKLEEELRFRADFEPLTGLYNRRRFNDELERHLRLPAGPQRRGALLMCDLDHFKLVNDSLGHAAGDDVLRRTARIITSRVRATDVVARLGGDEFAILLTGVDEDAAMHLAGELQRELADPDGRPSIGASIGVACFGGNESVVGDDLMVGADAALYEAKEGGRNAVVRFTGPKASSLTWIERIRAALDHDRLVLHSQPIVDLRTGAVVAEELLVRMLDDDGSLIAPGEFLPTAERFGFVESIDAWALARGLELAATGRAVNVNISARTMQDGRVVEAIARAAASGVDPALVMLEITETSAISNMDLVRDLAERLSALGCGLALDDFGTGFGTFMYLKHLPIDVIKIDREFVRDLAQNRADQRMIKAIVEIARASGQRTVAEGVEDVMSLDLLRRFGVDRAQGYYLARPAPLGARVPELAAGAAELYDALARAAAA